MLTITEELFVITLYERKSTIAPSPMQAVPYALIGAMFVDLISAGKVRAFEEKRILLVDAAPCGDRTLDAMLDAIQGSPKSKKLTYWIMTFGNRFKKLQRLLFDNLIEKGILAVNDEQYAWVIPFPGEPHQNASVKYQRKQALRALVLGGEPPDEHSLITLYMLNTFGLLDCLFTQDEFKAAVRKVKDILKAEGSTSPLLRQIDEISVAAAIASSMGEMV